MECIKRGRSLGKRFFKRCAAGLLAVILFVQCGFHAQAAQVAIEAPSAILIEASTGKVVFEQYADEKRSPASITKIMTLLIIFETLNEGKIDLSDDVMTSAYAKSMGGSQVFLEEGETQTLDTMIKCIAVASGNDASVAVAEHIAGSEAEFVAKMNAKAKELGMTNTHFEDCCGLTDSDNHYTTARDVAIMSRELTTKYPQIFDYTKIWMEDITHVTAQGSSVFTLSSTNKLLRQYEWATGLKTGSTSKAKYCLSATASKDGIDLIAVVMAAPDPKVRFQDAVALLNYGFNVCNVFVDTNETEAGNMEIRGGVEKSAPLCYEGEFRYVDIEGNDLGKIEKIVHLPEYTQAPVAKGQVAGEAEYFLNGKAVGSVPILFSTDVEKAKYIDYLREGLLYFLL